VILFALKSDPVLPDPDDGGDDANREAAAFERPTLFDMRLEITDMAAAFSRGAGPTSKPYFAQRVPYGRPLLRSRAPSISASVSAPT
jgi:hypothetical protein